MATSGLIMLISGTGGAGKNTVINGMVERGGFQHISSYTTRDKRVTDVKNQYQYITAKKFESKIKSGEIFEYDMFNGNYYGTSKQLFVDGLNNGNVVMKDISVNGYKNIIDHMGQDFNIVSVFLTETKKVIKQRLVFRGESADKLRNRLKLYDYEQSQIPFYNFVIRNNVYLHTLERLSAITDFANGKINILPTKDCGKIKAKYIDKLATKQEQGKMLKPIQLAVSNGQLFIVDGVHRYLASLKSGINIVMQFVDVVPHIVNLDVMEWNKIVDSYK